MYEYIYRISDEGKKDNNKKVDKFDYVNSDGKDKCIEYLILKQFDKDLKGIEKELFENSKNILYAKEHVYYKDLTYSGADYLFGYKIAKNGKLKYYKLDEDNSNFIEVSSEEKN